MERTFWFGPTGDKTNYLICLAHRILRWSRRHCSSRVSVHYSTVIIGEIWVVRQGQDTLLFEKWSHCVSSQTGKSPAGFGFWNQDLENGDDQCHNVSRFGKSGIWKAYFFTDLIWLFAKCGCQIFSLLLLGASQPSRCSKGLLKWSDFKRQIGIF